MQAIVLAAGKGSRTLSNIPKTLIKIQDERTILDFIVEGFSKKIGRENITIVVGFKKELIIKHSPSLAFVYNSEYNITGPAKSLLCGLKKINDDIIVINSDIFLDHELLDRMFATNKSCVLVNTKKDRNEAMKYDLDEKGYIKKLSKQLSYYKGESLGVYIIRKQHLNSFKEELANVDNQSFDSDALNNLIAKNKLNLIPIYTKGLLCHDIDFPSDIKFVCSYLSRKIKLINKRIIPPIIRI